MTTPVLAIESATHGRLYRDPALAPEGFPVTARDEIEGLRSGALVPSVTNVLGVACPPALAAWRERSIALAAVGVADELVGRAGPDGIAAACKRVVDAAGTHAMKAAARGDRLHRTFELLARGEPVDVADADRGAVGAWLAFCAAYGVEFLEVETTLLNRQLRYAGTADAICRIGGRTVVVDWKSGTAVRPHAALQVTALAHAPVIVRPDGSESPAPVVDAGLVVHFDDSTYAVRLVRPTDRLLAYVAACRTAWDVAHEQVELLGPWLARPEQLAELAG